MLIKLENDGIKIPLNKNFIDLRAVLRAVEECLVDRAMKITKSNKGPASQLLGIHRTTLIMKLKARRERKGTTKV